MLRHRRDFLRFSAGSLLAAGWWPGSLRAADAPAGEFHFIAVNDLHSLDKKCIPWFEKVIKQMKDHSEKIDFILISGDQANDGKVEQQAAIRDLFKTLDKPFYTTVGNHDWASMTDRKGYDEIFPDRLNYQFEHQSWQFVALDTSEGTKSTGTKIQPHTIKYLDDTLPKLDKKRPTVVFTHFPLGEKVNMRPTNADDVLKRFQDFNLKAIYSGHFHGFTEKKSGEAILTTNKCCAFARGNHDGTKEKGYFLCKAKDDKIERTFVEVKPL